MQQKVSVFGIKKYIKVEKTVAVTQNATFLMGNLSSRDVARKCCKRKAPNCRGDSRRRCPVRSISYYIQSTDALTICLYIPVRRCNIKECTESWVKFLKILHPDTMCLHGADYGAEQLKEKLFSVLLFKKKKIKTLNDKTNWCVLHLSFLFSLYLL